MEKWKEIKGIDGAYISNLGRAKSIVGAKETILKPQIYKRKDKVLKPKYRFYFDRRKTQGRAFYIFAHNAVADAFIKTGKGRVLFIDGDTLNNRADNLVRMYDQQTENCNHVIEKLKKRDSKINKAAISFIKGDSHLIYKELYSHFDEFKKKCIKIYQIDASSAEDCFMSVLEKFILRIKTGLLNEVKNAVGLFWVMLKYECKAFLREQYRNIQFNDNLVY